jgi:hypothetical protein
MLRFAKTFGCLALLAFGGQLASGYALLGPNANEPDTWQIPDIGYMLGGRDIGAPKNIGEEYRWNTPVIYYGFDQSFLDYFGSNGVWAVEQAAAVINGLTNFSKYSANLSEVPLETRRSNFRAKALQLVDLKTWALYFMVEELGLTEPDRYTWTLRSRETQPGLSCPWMIYGVIKRNFDPVTWEPSSYVNGTLYSYIIQEICSGGPPLATTVPFAVDPVVINTYPLMSRQAYAYIGNYVTSLTRDDVGGLRYIYRTNNVNWESMSSDSSIFTTNTGGGQQLLITSNLTFLAQQALTNNAAALQGLYPDLNIVSTANIFTNIWVTNTTAYFTNYPMDPVGTPPHLAFTTTRTLTIQSQYHHTFGNLMTFAYRNGTWVMVPVPDVNLLTGRDFYTVQTTTVTNSAFDLAGAPPHTSVSSVTYQTNEVVGEYFILPPSLCSIAIIGLQATFTNSYTNVVSSSTNAPVGSTNIQSFTQAIVNYSTNHAFTYYPVECITANTNLRQGIDHFTFVRASYDSLVGRFFQPITNIYTQVIVTNSQPITVSLRRVVTKPDFLFTSRDMGQPNAGVAERTQTIGNFNDANKLPGLSGPGNIEPNMTVTFNRVGPYLENIYGTNFIFNGLSESTADTNVVWASFDGTTNAPVIYPNGTSIANLEAQILFQITTALLPGGTTHAAYPVTQLQATGAQSLAWSLAAGSLPPGLGLSPSGVISGTPSSAGTYSFTVRLTGIIPGGYSRTITRPLSITINP